jgi:hypothetical protein
VRFTQFLNVATSQRPTDLGIKILEILVLAKKLRAILKMLGGRTIDFKFIQFWNGLESIRLLLAESK